MTNSGIWVNGGSVDVKVFLGKHLGALVNRTAGTVKDTAQHVLGDTKLQAVAGELDPCLSNALERDLCCTTAADRVCLAIKRTFFTSIPVVPSKTCGKIA